jgi:hypothetical protein
MPNIIQFHYVAFKVSFVHIIFAKNISSFLQHFLDFCLFLFKDLDFL